jgi:anti-sigma factor RsiW
VSGCDFEVIEAYALGELDEEGVGRARAHLGGCEACSRELALLGVERRALAAYGRSAPRPLPDFGAVLARSKAVVELPAARKKRQTATRVWVGVFAAAAVVLQILPARGPSPFSPFSSFSPSDPSTLVCRIDDALRFDVASAEDAFRACLMVTPAYQPPAFAEDGAHSD